MINSLIDSMIGRHVRQALDGELEAASALRLELSEAKKSHQTQQDRDAKKLADLSRFDSQITLY